MQQLKRLSTLLVVLLAAVAISTTATAWAHDGTDDSTDSSTETSQEAMHHLSAEKRAEFRQKAQDEVDKRRSDMSDKKAKNAEERKNHCESHKQGLTNKFSRIVSNAKKHQTRIDKFLDKATTYKDSSNLDPENWETLLASAQAAKDTSTASIADLEEITPTIDCNSDSVASDVATFKEAATKVRDDLKAYKTSVKSLLKSLIDAKQATTTTTTTESDGSTQ